MKFETADKPKFKPFTITVECQDEANLLCELFGSIDAVTCGAFGLDEGTLFNWYSFLDKQSNQKQPALTIKLNKE